MENETLAAIFLAVIAIGAILQAGFLAGLMIGVGKAQAKIDALADDYDNTLRPLTMKLVGATSGVSNASDTALAQAQRLEVAIDNLADRLEDGVDRAGDALGDAVETGAASVEQGVRSRVREKAEKALAPLGRVSAVYRGFSRGLAVWKSLQRRGAEEES